MSFCPFFKNGYFAVCNASGSDHVPSIADMEEYCFKDHLLCPVFDLHTIKDSFIRIDTKPLGMPLNGRSPEK